MAQLGRELSHLLADMNPEAAKLLKIARNKEAYVRAVKRVCRGNIAMADLILEHTNAFYVRREDVLRKGAYKDKPFIVCEICVDDSLVSSEVNMHREMLQLALAYEGVHFDELRIKPAKWGMRERHPFAVFSTNHVGHNAAYDEPASAARNGADADACGGTDNLETVKRAFCLVFAEEAARILEEVNAAKLELVRFDNAVARREKSRCFWLHLFCENERARAVIAEATPALIARARELGLHLRAIQTHPATPDMKGTQAFPATGAPVAFEGNAHDA